MKFLKYQLYCFLNIQGGGTAAHLMLELWPSLQLEGWEIDDIVSCNICFFSEIRFDVSVSFLNFISTMVM